MYALRVHSTIWIATNLVACLSFAACAPAPAPAPAVPTATIVPTEIPPTAVPTPLPTAAPTATPTRLPTATLTATPVRPVLVQVVQHAALGKILADGDGRTLYLFTRDTKNTVTCYDECARSWPPFLAQGKTDVAEGVSASLIGTATRREGTAQVTFNGAPLYYRATDAKAGDTTGQGSGNIWWVIAPDGNAVTRSSSPSATPTEEKSGGGYGH